MDSTALHLLIVLGISLACLSAQANEVVQTPFAHIDEPLHKKQIGHHETAVRLWDLRQQLAENLRPDSLPEDAPGPAEPRGHLTRRKKRFWSSSESESEGAPEEPDRSGYAAAMDALLEYYTGVQAEGRRVVDMPDMTKRSSQRVFFVSVSKVLSVSGVKLRVPGTLARASRVSAQALPGAGDDVDMSMDVRLGDFETWGQYDAKIGGVGPSGDFSTTIRDRVVRVTVRFHELLEGVEGDVPGRCSLQADELRLVERGSSDVPAMLAGWAAEVEDVPTTLRVMKQLLDERLAQFPCGAAFVQLVRRGDAAPEQ